MAFTQAQKNWFKAVAGGKCQASIPHYCNIDDPDCPGEIDHLLPQSWLAHFLTSDETATIFIDSPQNGLYKCQNAHSAKHPERQGYRRSYHALKIQGKDAFQIMHSEHLKSANQGMLFWNNTHDHIDLARALQLWQSATEPYPWSKKQRQAMELRKK